MSAITTHILDTARGLPAVNVRIQLRRREGETWIVLANGITNADGRERELLPEVEPVPTGEYQLVFEVGEYFAALGQAAFFPRVEITFVVQDPAAHYHVPLLLSPYGFSTYRGS
jgi:5-hydroxyisourate hydrolase